MDFHVVSTDMLFFSAASPARLRPPGLSRRCRTNGPTDTQTELFQSTAVWLRRRSDERAGDACGPNRPATLKQGWRCCDSPAGCSRGGVCVVARIPACFGMDLFFWRCTCRHVPPCAWPPRGTCRHVPASPPCRSPLCAPSHMPVWAAMVRRTQWVRRTQDSVGEEDSGLGG